MDIRWDRIDKVCERIKNNQQEFNMEGWFASKGTVKLSLMDPALASFLQDGIVPTMSCGTTACFGGETIVLFPEEAKRLNQEFKEELVLPSGRLIYICATILGIPRKVGEKLFYKLLWPFPYRNMKDVEGLMALIDRAKREGSFDFMLEE